MASILDAERRMISLGDGTVALEQWKIERLSDESFEYHAYVGLNYRTSDGAGGFNKRLSKGAVFMIFRITNPQGVESTTEYFMGHTGIEGDADDLLTTSWAGRAGLDYKRFDEVLLEFFS